MRRFVILAAALLFCASSAYAQVIEEGGFPVKGGDISEESFSLSCPSRLYARPGESVLFSCTARGVPEEGVRYEWRSVSGEGLRLLSNAQVLDPLFIVSLSGGREYGYRLTATGPGVYATASVTVMVEGAPAEAVGARDLQEECDPLTIPDEPGRYCAEEKGPFPLGFGPEEEEDGFLFPEAPAPPDQLSGPVRSEGSDSQAPPRLECPAAVFLEELETGQIECRAWDASGEEYLDYFWEPAGGTTRDYLDNPRLIPEDSPHPLVVAPETPAYETLESFHSGETTFRYQYRLTATSRATGLSSHEEVEVYVSSNRPSVYCPLEVLVEEGGTVTVDCEGADPLSSRMDYDEEAASVLWEWEGLWGTSTVPLAATDLASPLFTAPAGSAGEEYHYIASMTTWASGAPRTARRRVTVMVIGAEEETRVAADDSSPMFKGNAPSIMCEDAEAYEDTADFPLDCEVSGTLPSGATYSWTGTDVGARLTGTSSLTPTFLVPPEVGGSDKQYDYTVTLSAGGAAVATADIAVTVLEKPDIDACVSLGRSVFEGRSDIRLEGCSDISGAPNPDYRFNWAPHGSTTNTNLLSATNIERPWFYVPDNVSQDEVYEYAIAISADNADPHTYYYEVTVMNTESIDIACEGNPYTVYEGGNDITLNCEASGAPSGSYSYVWTARGDTPGTGLLSSTNMESPTFAVPGTVTRDETYEYLLTVTEESAGSASAEVTVTVLNKKALALVCSDPVVYEGSADIALDCEASGAPSGSYSYVWTARGDTPDTALLSGTNMAPPTFAVPDAVTRDETYEYLLTVSAENAEDATAEVTVTVLNRRVLSVTCASPGSVYEGSADVAFDCEASGAPAGYAYNYAWTARGDTQDTSLLSATNIASPMFYVPNDVAATTTYEYLLTVSAANARAARANVTVTVLNRRVLSVTCASPGSVPEGSEEIAFDCEASGAPAGYTYNYAWTARGDTQDTSLLSATNIASPIFYVPNDVAATTTYEYLLTVSAPNAQAARANVTVTVLNVEPLVAACADPGSVYEGSEDITFDCTVSGAPAGSNYTYGWTAWGDTPDTALLSNTRIASPTFYVPEEVAATTIYEYLLRTSAEHAEYGNDIHGSARVTVTVLNKEPLVVACSAPGSVYEGAEDIVFDCEASGAPEGSAYAYAWTTIGDTQDASLLSATDVASPTFFVPDEVDEDETYEYLLTVSAENAEDASAEVAVTVLNKEPLAVACADPGSVYEGSEDIAFDCEASGAPGDNPQYTYAWTAVGDTQDTSLLSATDVASPTFFVPDEVDEDETYEYLLTVSAENAEDASAEVAVTVLNKEPLVVACADPGSVYEGAEDIAFDCSASGAPEGSAYAYAWTAVGDTQDTSLLSATDVASPTFFVPDEVDEDETHDYLLTVSAENAVAGTAEVTVTVLARAPLAFVDDSISGRVYVFTVGETITDVLLPEATGGLPPYTYTLAPALPEGLELDGPARTISGTPLEVSPRSEYAWQVTDVNTETVRIAFFIEVVPAVEPAFPPVASSSAREFSDPSALGVTVSVSSLRFGVQSAETQASLDPMTDRISTYLSGPYHAGRMTLSPGGSEVLDENGEMDLSIELASPVVLRREGGIEAASLVLAPVWSYAESCEQLSSQTIGGLYTEVTLSEDACRLLRFGGELDLADAPPGRYAGNMDIVLRSGEREETFAVETSVTVVAAQRVITIGPGGVRFSTSRELPAGLTEEQNLSIYPDVAFLTEGKSDGVFELSNPSLIPLEISVSARFGYTEATEQGREVVVEDLSQSRLGDLSGLVDIHPGVLVLQPGEKGFVRYGLKEEVPGSIADKGYAAFFDVASAPRSYADLDRMPEEVTEERTARVTIRVPGVYVPGEGASQLRARLLSISYPGSLSATFLLEAVDHPFAGEVVAYDGAGRELGRRETLVYTRSRVRIPLDRMPEAGAVFLRFSPRGSGRAPLPTSVEWNAP